MEEGSCDRRADHLEAGRDSLLGGLLGIHTGGGPAGEEEGGDSCQDQEGSCRVRGGHQGSLCLGDILKIINKY